MEKKRSFGAIMKKNMVLVLMAALFIYFSLFARNFFTADNMMKMLRQTAVVGIMCAGFSIVMIAGGLDLSVGSALSVVGCVTALLIVKVGLPAWLGCILGILVAILISGINAGLILVSGMPPMICTLAMQQVLQGIAYMLTGATPVKGLPASLDFLGKGYAWVIPVPVVIMVICFIICGFILNRTYIGRYFYAVGCNTEASRLSGLSVNFIKMLSYLINGAFTGLGALVMMSRIASGNPKAGLNYEMDVITACVVGGVGFNGGKGTIVGLIEGVLVMGIMTNGLGVKGVDSYTQMVFKGLVLIIVVGIDCFSQERARRERMKIKTTAK